MDIYIQRADEDMRQSAAARRFVQAMARALLLNVFERDSAADLSGTILHVDANNTTPALGLYESVGMRQIQIMDDWRRTDAI